MEMAPVSILMENGYNSITQAYSLFALIQSHANDTSLHSNLIHFDTFLTGQSWICMPLFMLNYRSLLWMASSNYLFLSLLCSLNKIPNHRLRLQIYDAVCAHSDILHHLENNMIFWSNQFFGCWAIVVMCHCNWPSCFWVMRPVMWLPDSKFAIHITLQVRMHFAPLHQREAKYHMFCETLTALQPFLYLHD